MTLTDCLKACVSSGATTAYCTRLSPTWIVLHVDLPVSEREELRRALRPLLGTTDDPRHSKRSVSIGSVEEWT